MSNKEENRESDSSSSCYADIGFMFAAAEPTQTLSLSFSPRARSAHGCCRCERESAGTPLGSGDGDVDTGDTCDAAKHSGATIRAEITAVDGDPGALQSGHYVWPASSALAQHLVDACDGISGGSCACTDELCQHCIRCRLTRFFDRLPVDRAWKLLELGSGCGLAGLVAMQVISKQHEIRCFAFTDHDPGTLTRSKENYDATLKAVKSCCRAETISSILTLFEPLRWGDADGALIIKAEALKAHNIPENEKTQVTFDLVLGSDLIYCLEIVRPLLLTALDMMSATAHEHGRSGSSKRSGIPGPSFFVLAQSFPYDEDTEEEIDNVCNEVGLTRSVVADALEQEEGVKIQVFCAQMNGKTK